MVCSAIGVKNWQHDFPSVEAVRPSRCVCCGAASRPAGGALVVVGHGVRGRQQWGPGDESSAPQMAEVRLRRYLCRRCGAVMAVGPRGVMRGHLYSAVAIAAALCLWARQRLPAAEVRRLVSVFCTVGATAFGGWRSLRRWAARAAGGLLWPAIAAQLQDTLRERVAHVVMRLIGHARGEAGTDLARAMLGAVHAI